MNKLTVKKWHPCARNYSVTLDIFETVLDVKIGLIGDTIVDGKVNIAFTGTPRRGFIRAGNFAMRNYIAKGNKPLFP